MVIGWWLAVDLDTRRPEPEHEPPRDNGVRRRSISAVADSEKRNAWISRLKLRAVAIELRDWEGLASEAYEVLTGRQPLAVRVDARDAAPDGAHVYVLGNDGVRLVGAYSPDSVSGLMLVASCQGCWRDVPLQTQGCPDVYAQLLEARPRIYCSDCLET